MISATDFVYLGIEMFIYLGSSNPDSYILLLLFSVKKNVIQNEHLKILITVSAKLPTSFRYVVYRYLNQNVVPVFKVICK